jgi:hypothetical protein
VTETVNHPAHYGGEDNPYEVIKVIEAWGLGFKLGQVLKYVGRPTKGNYLEDLKKARWYLDREIAMLEKRLPKTYEFTVGGGATSHAKIHNHPFATECDFSCPVGGIRREYT